MARYILLPSRLYVDVCVKIKSFVLVIYFAVVNEMLFLCHMSEGLTYFVDVDHHYYILLNLRKKNGV